MDDKVSSTTDGPNYGPKVKEALTKKTSNPIDDDDINISQWIANAIADTGCRVVYGGHGGALVPLVNAVCAHPDLTWVCARNEHDAATMAAAHAKMTGGLGVVIATSGPGATNLTTGLLEATMDRVALLAITGMKPTQSIGYSEFQDVQQSRLFAGAGIEFSKDVASPEACIPLLRDAVATALTRRTCAHLAIPVDIQAAQSPLPLKHFCASHANVRLSPPSVNEKYVQQAAETLVGKPTVTPPRNVIAVGLRAVYGNENGAISKAILDLAEALNAPVLTRLDAKGVVDETHPLSFGVIGVHGKPGLEEAANLISTSDRVVSIGVDDPTLLLCNSAGIQIRRLIEIQPDAIAVSTRFNAENTLLGNIAEVCQALTERVEIISLKVNKHRKIRTSTPERKETKPWEKFGYAMFNSPHVMLGCSDDEDAVIHSKLEELGPAKVKLQTDLMWQAMHNSNWRYLTEIGAGGSYRYHEHGEEAPGYCHPARVLEALSDLRADPVTDVVSRDAVVTVDVGDITLWASLCLHLKGGSRTLYSERLGTMGYALNAGVAGILAKPEPAGAVVLTGDGGLQMSLQEFATFQQMKRPGDKLLCIVFDNSVLGRVLFGFDDAAGCELTGPDYVALAKAYGGDGVRLDDSGRAVEVVKEAMQAEGLFVIHVIVDPAVQADMATFKDNAMAVMNSG